LHPVGTEAIPMPSLGGRLLEGRFSPRPYPLIAELAHGWHWVLDPNTHFTFRQRGPMRRFHLARHLVIPLLCRFPHELAMPHELVPVDTASLVYAHCSPRFPFCLPLPLGRPPSLPHSCIRRINSFLPHFFCRAWALLRPIMLAASPMSITSFIITY